MLVSLASIFVDPTVKAHTNSESNEMQMEGLCVLLNSELATQLNLRCKQARRKQYKITFDSNIDRDN